MDTQKFTTRTERVDDVPLLLGQIKKMRLAELIDDNFQAYGNWQGLSIGQVTTGWLSYILSQGDHRLNHVYAKREQEVLDARIKKVREAIAELNIRGRGRKVSDAGELRAAVDKILRKNKVENIVTANYHTETRIIRKRVYKERPARTVEKSQTTVESEARPARVSKCRTLPGLASIRE